MYKAFTSTGGPTNVVSIERVQNPKIYRRYIQEKEDMRRRRQQIKPARLHVMAFHGTSETSIDQIISNGFNRSYAGTAAGKAYGAGVYFARDARYSCRYSPSGTNQYS